MAVPKKRKSKSKSKMRRASSYFRVKVIQMNKCSNCNSLKRTHCVCPECGYYKNKPVVHI